MKPFHRSHEKKVLLVLLGVEDNVNTENDFTSSSLSLQRQKAQRMTSTIPTSNTSPISTQPEVKSALHSQVQSLVTNLGSYSNSSTPAYSLSILFALSTPFSFAANASSPVNVAQTIAQSSSSSYIPASASSSTTSSSKPSFLSSLKSKRPPVTPLPRFYILAAMSAAFGGAGYIIGDGDRLNGSGTATGKVN